MTGIFGRRKKTCRFQGCIKPNGLTVCTKDGSLRHADKCDKRHCPKWNNTPWKAFMWWWIYSPVFGTWKEYKEYWNRRWTEW